MEKKKSGVVGLTVMMLIVAIAASILYLVVNLL